MGRTLGRILLKVFGAFAVLFVAFVVISVILSLIVSLAVTALSFAISLAVLALFVLAAIGLASLVRGDNAEETREDTTGSWLSGSLSSEANDRERRDPKEKLRERYVAGEIDESTFERQMDLLLETEETETYLDGLGSRGADSSRTRERLWER